MPYGAYKGLPLFYQMHGPADAPADPVIFFNGWCQSERYWQPTVARLAQERLCVTYDSRGFGRSGAVWWTRHGLPQVDPHARTDPGPLAIGAKGYVEMPERMTATVESVAEEGAWLAGAVFGDRPYHIVGHSLGAVPAALVAAQHPERTRSLTIINSGVFDDFGGPQGSSLGTFIRIFVAARPVVALPVVRDAAVRRSANLPIDPQQARWLIEDFGLADGRLAVALAESSLDAAVLRRYRRDLIALPKQTRLLLVVGDSDQTIPPRGMYNLKRLRPDASLVNFPDCGHLPMLERPAACADALARFLAENE